MQIMQKQSNKSKNSVPYQDAKTVDVLYPKPSSSSKQDLFCAETSGSGTDAQTWADLVQRCPKYTCHCYSML